MKRCLSPALAGTVLVWFGLAGPAVRADFIEWSYSWSRSPVTVAADNDGTGGINLVVNPAGLAAGDSDIIAVNLATFSSAPAGTPDRFTDRAYSLTLDLTDTASQAAGSLTFTGLLNGTLSESNANITNTFDGPLTQTLLLGGNEYSVTIGPFTPPGPPTAENLGSISARVSVQGTQPLPAPVQEVPEPSGLVLVSLGLVLVGLGCWWQSKRKAGSDSAW
jgi:hypothetical protein